MSKSSIRSVVVICVSLFILIFLCIVYIIDYNNYYRSLKEKEYLSMHKYIEEMHKYINNNKDSFTKVINYEIEQYNKDNTDNRISKSGDFQSDRDIVIQVLNERNAEIYYNENYDEIMVSQHFYGNKYIVFLTFCDTEKLNIAADSDCIIEDDYYISIIFHPRC